MVPNMVFGGKNVFVGKRFLAETFFAVKKVSVKNIGTKHFRHNKIFFCRKSYLGVTKIILA